MWGELAQSEEDELPRVLHLHPRGDASTGGKWQLADILGRGLGYAIGMRDWDIVMGGGARNREDHSGSVNLE